LDSKLWRRSSRHLGTNACLVAMPLPQSRWQQNLSLHCPHLVCPYHLVLSHCYGVPGGMVGYPVPLPVVNPVANLEVWPNRIGEGCFSAASSHQGQPTFQ